MIQQFQFLIEDLKRWKCMSLRNFFYFFLEQAIWGTVFYRISRAFFLINIPVIKVLFRLIGFFVFKISESLLGVAIRPGADIGPGLYIGHAGLVMINEEVKAGKNLSIGSDLLIGLRGGGHKGAPILGDNVQIGAGAKILGKIKVGSNVRIGANSLVVNDVPNNVTVLGVPAKIIGPVFVSKRK